MYLNERTNRQAERQKTAIQTDGQIHRQTTDRCKYISKRKDNEQQTITKQTKSITQEEIDIHIAAEEQQLIYLPLIEQFKFEIASIVTGLRFIVGIKTWHNVCPMDNGFMK